MSSLEEKEDNIELADRGYSQPARPSRELHGETNALSNADQLTRHDLYHCHSGQTGLAGSSTVNYYDSVSRLRRNSEASVSLCLGPSPTQHHASNHAVNGYITFDTPSVSSSGAVERTFQSISTASNQPSRTFGHPRFLSGEVVLHAGRNKGRVPDSEEEPGVDQETGNEQKPNVEQEASIDRPQHPHSLLQNPRLDRPLLASYLHGRDAQLERRQHQKERWQHVYGAGDHCTAVRRDRCRVHGRLSKKHASASRREGSAGQDWGHDASTNWFIVDESAGACGTVYDRSGLAEQAGQAVERREKDWNITGCCDGVMFLFLWALAIAVVVGVVVKST